MSELIVLGTAASIPDEAHENTHMALRLDERVVLIDCASTPTIRLAKAGITLDDVTDIILTHFHPDHVSGIPLLLMNMWLSGRKQALRIYGLHHCLKRVEDMMGFYHWENWPNFFSVAFHRLPEADQIMVLEDEAVQILSAPVRHLVPTIGLRLQSQTNGSAIAYSSDTEPCPAVVGLARGAEWLFHEASGETVGHSSPEQAGEIAREAGAERLALIHYPPPSDGGQAMLAEARRAFDGEVVLATDFMRIPFA